MLGLAFGFYRTGPQHPRGEAMLLLVHAHFILKQLEVRFCQAGTRHTGAEGFRSVSMHEVGSEERGELSGAVSHTKNQVVVRRRVKNVFILGMEPKILCVYIYRYMRL